MSNLETFYNKLDKTFKEFNKNKKTIDLTLNIYPKYPTIYSMANMFLFAHEETALLPDKIKTINILQHISFKQYILDFRAIEEQLQEVYKKKIINKVQQHSNNTPLTEQFFEILDVALYDKDENFEIKEEDYFNYLILNLDVNIKHEKHESNKGISSTNQKTAWSHIDGLPIDNNSYWAKTNSNIEGVVYKNCYIKIKFKVSEIFNKYFDLENSIVDGIYMGKSNCEIDYSIEKNNDVNIKDIIPNISVDECYVTKKSIFYNKKGTIHEIENKNLSILEIGGINDVMSFLNLNYPAKIRYVDIVDVFKTHIHPYIMTNYATKPILKGSKIEFVRCGIMNHAAPVFTDVIEKGKLVSKFKYKTNSGGLDNDLAVSKHIISKHGNIKNKIDFMLNDFKYKTVKKPDDRPKNYTDSAEVRVNINELVARRHRGVNYGGGGYVRRPYFLSMFSVLYLLSPNKLHVIKEDQYLTAEHLIPKIVDVENMLSYQKMITDFIDFKNQKNYLTSGNIKVEKCLLTKSYEDIFSYTLNSIVNQKISQKDVVILNKIGYFYHIEDNSIDLKKTVKRDVNDVERITSIYNYYIDINDKDFSAKSNNFERSLLNFHINKTHDSLIVFINRLHILKIKLSISAKILFNSIKDMKTKNDELYFKIADEIKSVIRRSASRQSATSVWNLVGREKSTLYDALYRVEDQTIYIEKLSEFLNRRCKGVVLFENDELELLSIAIRDVKEFRAFKTIISLTLMSNFYTKKEKIEENNNKEDEPILDPKF